MSLKPSVFSLRWFDYYFSNDPSALLGRPDGYYDASGTLRRNRNNHLPDADCCHCHNSGCYVINCDEGAAGIFGIILLAGFAIVALCLICLYPPAMIVFWVFMVIGSLAETVAGRDPSCHYVRLYGSVSAGLTLIYIVLILYQVYELQRRYNGYYPGTPGEIIDMPRAIRFFRLNTIMFVLLAICCVPLAITGVYIWSQCPGSLDVKTCATHSDCYWTYITGLVWSVVQIMNLVAFSSMAYRMNLKRIKLSKPPAYEQVEGLYGTVLMEDPSSTDSLPRYQA